MAQISNSQTLITLRIRMSPDDPQTQAAALELLRDGLTPSQISMTRLRKKTGDVWYFYGSNVHDISDMDVTPVTRREEAAMDRLFRRLFGDEHGWAAYDEWLED